MQIKDHPEFKKFIDDFLHKESLEEEAKFIGKK